MNTTRLLGFCGFSLAVVGCLNSNDSAVVTTKTGIDCSGYNVDSVTVTVMIEGDTTEQFTQPYRSMDNLNKIRWDIEAPENAAIQLDARIWHQNRVVATQIYGWVSGSMPGDGGNPVPAPIPAPKVLFNDTLRVYKDIPHPTRDPLWAYPGSSAAQAEITEIGWDTYGNDQWWTYADNSFGVDVDSFWIEADYRDKPVGTYAARVLVRDAYNRLFIYPRVVEVLDGPGSFVDSRDGQTYLWRTIGRRDWMVQNLNYAGTGETANHSWCYDSLPENCTRYGRLYTWDAAMDFSYTTYNGICPEGWRLPLVEDFAELKFISDMGGTMETGPAVSWMSDSLWMKSDPNSTGQVYIVGADHLGFAVLPAGRKNPYGDPLFEGLSTLAGFWTGERTTWPENSKAIDMQVGSAMLQMGYGTEVEMGYSVRCTRDRWYF